MNISLKKSKSASTKNFNYGLNKRGTSSVLMDGSSSEDEGGNNHDQRKKVESSVQLLNKELLSEQAALRQRAESAMKNATNCEIYDYDGQYESFASGKEKAETKVSQDRGERKKSRYVETLLNHAKERQYERELVLERKIAREQAAEDTKGEFLGKEKFVTKSYKRKLEEREAWKHQDDEKNKMNEENDVTKKKEEGLLGFYKNIGQFGGAEETVKNSSDSTLTNNIAGEQSDESRLRQKDVVSHMGQANIEDEDNQCKDEVQIDKELEQETLRVKTLEKVLKARERYLKRAQLQMEKVSTF
jgi:coiled-coil domain-containing protein 55